MKKEKMTGTLFIGKYGNKNRLDFGGEKFNINFEPDPDEYIHISTFDIIRNLIRDRFNVEINFSYYLTAYGGDWYEVEEV